MQHGPFGHVTCPDTHVGRPYGHADVHSHMLHAYVEMLHAYMDM